MYYRPHTPNEWDSFLEQKYGYGLWEFADSIVQFLINRPGLNYLDDPITRDKLRNKIDFIEHLEDGIKKFKYLKKEIIKTIDDYYDYYDIFRDNKFRDFSKMKSYIRDFKLLPFFGELNKIIKRNNRLISRAPSNTKIGRPVHLRNQLASIWAQVIKDKRGSNWMVIELLLTWFYDNFEGTDYRKELGEKRDDFNQFNLKNEYYRLKRKYMNYMIGFRNTFFPENKEIYRSKIEFNKENVMLGKPGKILIVFPNGITFP